MVFATVFAANYLAFGRSFNGDYMTLDGKIVCDQPAMVKGIAALAEMHKAEILPRNMSALSNEEITTMIMLICAGYESHRMTMIRRELPRS